MQDKELLSKAIKSEHSLEHQRRGTQNGQVEGHSETYSSNFMAIPVQECDEECPTHDHRHRQWRHLDTCGFVTMVEAEAPRIDCKHGVHQAMACGFRNRTRFRTAILFHKGGLSLLTAWLSEDYPH